MSNCSFIEIFVWLASFDVDMKILVIKKKGCCKQNLNQAKSDGAKQIRFSLKKEDREAKKQLELIQKRLGLRTECVKYFI